MKGVKKIFQTLALALALTAAGQSAWATTKTVTYTVTNSIQIGNGNNNYQVTITRSGDDPFDGTGPDYSIEMSRESLYAINGTYGDYTFTLADGFKLHLEWGAGSGVSIAKISGTDNYCIQPDALNGKQISYGITCDNDKYYYVTHLTLIGKEGTWTNSNVVGTEQWHFSKNTTTGYSLSSVTITYSDSPDISIFESDGENTYKIKSKEDLRHLANYVNNGHNDCGGLTFLQTQPITCDNTYVPIGYYRSISDRAGFSGTYKGQGKTVSDITVSRTATTSAGGYIGLFGYVVMGTVENVILASSTFTGANEIGGIVGYNWGGTVQNCRVESTVTIKAGGNGASHHGGIVGENYSGEAKVIGCYSAASILNNNKSDHVRCGGIVGDNYGGTIKDCLYTGTTIEAAKYKGAIMGNSDGKNATFANNYYTSAINIGGVGAEGSSSDQDGARRARTVTLGDNVVLVGDETIYDVSGLTAIGTGNYALRYNDGTTKIYSGEGQTLTLAYTGNVPTGGSVVYTVTKNLDQSDITADVLSGSTLTIPAANVTISATVAATTVATTYIDADGNSRTVAAIPLLGIETSLGDYNETTWYVVNSDVSYDHEVTLYGDVHLILADGKTMTMTVSDDNKLCIWGDSDLCRNFTIYGQSDGTGTLNATSVKSSALATNNLTINGGRIIVTAYYYALFGNKGVTINGGVINATSENRYGIFCENGNITINGGQVVSDGISCGQDHIILFGYRNDTDYITIGSGKVHFANIAAGKSMTDGTNIYRAPADYNLVISTILANVTLRPAIPASVELTLAQGTKDGVIAYWGTFYDSAAGYSLPAGATAYTMDENKNLYRLGTDGSKIPAGVPVVIISEVSAITLTKEDGIVTAADNAPGGNILRGTNGLVELEYDPNDNKYKVDGKFPYVLSVREGVIGFRKFVGVGSSAAIPAHKAYYLVTP